MPYLSVRKTSLPVGVGASLGRVRPHKIKQGTSEVSRVYGSGIVSKRDPGCHTDGASRLRGQDKGRASSLPGESNDTPADRAVARYEAAGVVGGTPHHD